MSKKILVLGITGMLGASIFRVLANSGRWTVSGTARMRESAEPVARSAPTSEIIYGVDAADLRSIEDAIMTVSPDVVINCIGVVKQLDNESNRELAIAINALLPHQLARICSAQKARLIHFSTDCVFNGDKGRYVESDVADATDLYGRSKAMGEVKEAPHLTIRTSIIGHEIATSHSLIDWFLRETGTISGYRRAIFSGLPTVKVARLLNEVLLVTPVTGLFHLSAKPINKFDLLKLVASQYHRLTTIVPSDDLVIDRSLESGKLKAEANIYIESWPDLITLMRDEYEQYFEAHR